MNWAALWISFGIVFTVVSLGLAWQARLRGLLLLDAGRLQEPVLSSHPIAYIPVALLLVYAWFESKRPGSLPFLGMVAEIVGLLVVVVVMKKRVHLRFTDQGVCLLGIIRWSEIRSHRWVEGSGGIARLDLAVSKKKRNYTVAFAISAIHRERIEGILAANVSSGTREGRAR